MSATVFARGKYLIKAKGYQETSASIHPGTNQLSALDKIGGSFRLKEFSSAANKEIETELVTYFLAKNQDVVSFQVNCARKINLHYELSDAHNKHKLLFSEAGSYDRLMKEFDLSHFKNGLCSISVFNEKNELIHTIEFEKAALQ
jgi:hypothetical protein